MKPNSTEKMQEALREGLLNRKAAQKPAERRDLSGQVIAAIYRCQSCGLWWINSRLDVPEARLIHKLVEPHSETYLWQDTGGPDLELRFDEEGQVVWPENGEPGVEGDGRDSAAHEESSPFAAYVSQSKNIAENMFVIAAWEARQELNAWGYTADINDVREQMDEMRSAFKDAVYSYAPLLPPGWRVTADYDKWLKGQACAGFLHGEINPDASLMIGGRCSTVAELEIKLDRLFRLVCEMTC